MRRFLALLPALPACWTLDLPPVDTSSIPFDPEVGAPEGWVVQSFPMSLTCPDGAPSRLVVVYPEAAAEDRERVKLPVALIFHSGAFDYVLSPDPEDPTSGTSFRQTQGDQKRVTSRWALEHAYATLGLYPNYASEELHAGTLAAALATKGIAMALPTNCWGDWWHNRQSAEQNNFSGDYFLRDGRTAAEFAWLHLTDAFPAANALEIPFGVDTDRLYLIGLGSGSRAVSELLSLRATVDGAPGPFLYRPASVVLDSPADDLRPFYDNDSAYYDAIQTGLFRIFPGGRDTLNRGSLAAVPAGNLPPRIGLLFANGAAAVPADSNAAMLRHLDTLGRDDVWTYRTPGNFYVLSNANVQLAKAVADFVVDGLDAVPDSLITDVDP